MAGFLLLLCVVAIVGALTIVYLLYGPAPAQPLAPVPRASMTIIPQTRASVGTYNPEAVFAAEHSSAIADASRAFATITPLPAPPAANMPAPLPFAPQPALELLSPARSHALPPPTPSFMRSRVTSPQPLPRARAARGTDSPRAMRLPRASYPASDVRDSFVELDPTLLADETMAS
ncbi:MAG: hypothetical protein SFX73_30375 [Kofleriaceae bacterium]|nr:hypothetical protein [Kofleriaceae bacterium]